MDLVTIVCPHCGFSRSLNRDAIPAGAAKATCPKCKQAFPLSGSPVSSVSDTGRAKLPETSGGADTSNSSTGPTITLTCPRCRFSQQVAESTASEQSVLTCPRCREVYSAAEAMGNRNSSDESYALTSTAFSHSGGGATPPGPASRTAEPERKPVKRTLQFQFTGTAKEYFGIWIVNTLLKIITLGVYSAWAKVRKRRYFYGNTILHKAPFDYLAEPRALFRGWLIAVLFFLAYSFGSQAHPAVPGIFGLLFLIVMPWLVVRSRLFNLRNSSYRNIRFCFQPNYKDSYKIFAGLTILLPFTLGLIFPYMMYRQKKFLIENSSYGNTPFVFEGTAGDFYKLYLKAAAGMILLLALLFSIAFASFGLDNISSGNLQPVFAVIPMVVFPLIYFYMVIYVQTSLARLVWNKTKIGRNRFSCSLRTRKMASLYLTNAAAIFLSLGMMIPWASIRLNRYWFDNLALEAFDDLNDFVASSQADIGAAGEEIGDLFGIDMAL